MNTTTTITPTDALDLRPLLELRAESDELGARLRADDDTAIERARELLAIDVQTYRDALEAVEAHGHTSAREIDTADGLGVLVSVLGVGDLGADLDALFNRRMMADFDRYVIEGGRFDLGAWMQRYAGDYR